MDTKKAKILPMLTHLAAPRVATVQAFFQTTSQNDLLGCYAWCQALSSGLLPILGDFEVSLRNALHRSFSQKYGNVDSLDWMRTRPNPAADRNPKAKPLPALHRMGSRMQDDIKSAATKVGRRKSVVTQDDIVAALPFGFWEQIINALDHPSQPAGMQADILSEVFPYAPDLATCAYAAPAFKYRVVKLLSQIRDVRNRIGHHDAIWAIPEFNRGGIVGFYPRRPRHTVNSLKLLVDSIAWFAAWISPEVARYMRNSDHWWSFESLLSRQALAVYRTMGGRIGTYELVLRLKSQSSPVSLRSRKPMERKLKQLQRPLHLRQMHY